MNFVNTSGKDIGEIFGPDKYFFHLNDHMHFSVFKWAKATFIITNSCASINPPTIKGFCSQTLVDCISLKSKQSAFRAFD